MPKVDTINYGSAILSGFQYLLSNYPNVFAIGQGLWSPWYVGNTMMGLEVDYGKHRVIDTPVSEQATTGAAIGASLCGYRPIVVHPRIDFMILAIDQLVNQAAKWSYMLGGNGSPCVTIRGIVNRGGEQGAQHSQALHSWFAHIPGLRVVMPATVADARDLLISSVLCDDPVLYIDDRWLYELEDELPPPEELSLCDEGPKIICKGNDVTLVGASYTTKLCDEAGVILRQKGINAEIIDMRIINPLDCSVIAKSVSNTRKLLVVDGGWQTCGLAGEIIASVVENLDGFPFMAKRLTLVNSPAPTSKVLEDHYYPTTKQIVDLAIEMLVTKKMYL